MIAAVQSFGHNVLAGVAFASPFLAVIAAVAHAFRRELAEWELDAASVLDNAGRGHGAI